METTLQCDQCSAQFTGKTSWARFCSQHCRNAWWRHQYKLAEAQAEVGQVNWHGAVSGTAIVEALKYGREPAAPVAEPMRRRQSI